MKVKRNKIYLNRYKRLGYTGDDEEGYVVTFSDGVETCGNDLSITKNGIELKKGYDVILPLTEDNKTFIAYSENGKMVSGTYPMPNLTKQAFITSPQTAMNISAMLWLKTKNIS